MSTARLTSRNRSAQNALQHGLTRVSSRHPLYREDIYAIARLMCGEDGRPDLFETAVRVAECDVLIREIRSYQTQLIARLRDPQCYPIPLAGFERKLRLAAHRAILEMGERLEKAVPSRNAPPEKKAEFDKLADEYFAVCEDRKPETALMLSVPELLRLTRYERRAWSRRKRGFLQFMAVQRGYRTGGSLSPIEMVEAPL